MSLAARAHRCPVSRTGGRLAVISFHSLEDRLVKQFFRRHTQAFGGDARLARLAIATNALPVPPLKLIGRAIRRMRAKSRRIRAPAARVCAWRSAPTGPFA